jgi:hypothetical protein
MSRLRVALLLGVVLSCVVAAPVAARPTFDNHLHVSSCFATFTATWSGVPGRARTYELLWVSDGIPRDIPLLSGVASRAGSLVTPNIGIEGGGELSSLLVFHDAVGRTVFSIPNEEGQIPIDCH